MEELQPISGAARAEHDEETEETMKQLKLKYGALMCIVLFAALFFRWVPSANYIFREIDPTSAECIASDGDTNACISFTVTLRLSFTLCVFFIIHTLLGCRWSRSCLGPRAFRSACADFFIVRLVLLAGFFVGTLFMPYDFFQHYAEGARIAAIGFLLMQAIVLLDCVCSLNDYLVPKDGYFGCDPDDEARRKRIAIAITIFSYAATIALVTCSYHWFAPSTCTDERLTLNQFCITFTVVYGVLSTLFAVWAQKGAGSSVLVSGCVFLYLTVMTWSALSSGAKDKECFTLWSDPTEVSAATVISLLVAAVAIVRSAVQAGGSRQAFALHDISDTDETFGFFFITMALGACYMAMALCSWQVSVSDTHALMVENSEESMWIKMASVWFTMAIFTTAQVSPYMCGPDGFCCHDRTFD